MLIRFFFGLFLFFLSAIALSAEQCSAVFPDAVQNNSNSGTITFAQDAQVLNSPDNILASTNGIIDSVNLVLTCGTSNCTHSGSTAAAVIYNGIPNSNLDITIGYADTLTLEPGNYNNIILETNAELILKPGDYTLSGYLSLEYQNTISILGDGVVRFFVKGGANLPNGSESSPGGENSPASSHKGVRISGQSDVNIAGDTTSFLLYAKHDVLIDFQADFNGFIYSNSDVELFNESVVTGAISGKNVLIGYQAITHYIATEPDFGDFCGGLASPTPPVLLGLYQFEQTDFNSQINDTSGFNHHSTNMGGASIAEGKYCRGFDSNGTNQGTETDNAFASNVDLINDIGEQGSISFWFNSNTAWNEGGYNGGERTLFDGTLANDNNVGNKYLALEILNTGRLRFEFEDSSDYDFKLNEPENTALRNANTWYYLTTTWDYINNSFQLYVDGNLLIGQTLYTNGEMVDLGGIVFGDNATVYATNNHASLPSRTSANGRFDEVRIYKKVLSQAEIQADMIDDSACTTEILAEWRMDEISWSGAVGEVVDQTGNFNGQAENGANTEKSTPAIVGNPGTCGYGDFDGVNDYVAIPDFDNLQGSFTITAWIKASNLQRGSRIFIDDEDNNQGGYGFSISDDTDSGHLRFYSRGVIPISVDTSNDIIDTNTWTFVTAVHDATNKTRQIYVNGVAQILSGGSTVATYSGEWGVDTGIATIGGETDNGETDKRFTGNIDEVRIYNSALTQSEIAVIQEETHPCSEELIAEWRMDEISWSGVGEEVIDQTGNFNAQAIAGANTAQASPAIVGNPGTCGYGEFDGVDDYIELADDPAFDLETELTITTWIRPHSIPASGLKTILSKDENYEFHLDSSGEVFWWWGSSSFTTTGANIVVDTWYHVAITYKSGEQLIYINGIERGRYNFSGSLPLNTDPLQIGQDQDFSGRYFDGDIDEVRIYGQALTQSDIVAIKEETHPCDMFIDHFEIDAIDGQGLTCEADNINIKACADASCTLLNTVATDVQLSINGDFHKTVTVVGSTDTTINFTTAGQANLSVNQTYQCINGNPNDCDVTFADTGFRFFANNEGSPIPTQLSGKPSNTGYNASTLQLQAIEKNPDSGACQAAVIDTTVIEMAATCIDPIACAGNNVAIDNLSTTTNIDTLGNSESLTYSSVGLDFSDDSVNTAEFIFTYPDAGKVQLHARYNIPDEDGNPSGNYMSGASSAFVVKPFGFYINVDSNPQANSHLGAVFIAAGEEFTTHLTAVQWQSGDDNDSNGVPDDGANLSNNGAAVNFGNETTSETAIINHDLFLPNPAELGDLANNDFSNFVNGVATNSAANDTAMTYDEVGIISFTAELTDNSYLGVDDVFGIEPYVGRFIPHHFELSVAADGSLASVCAGVDVDMDYAYIGQGTVDNADVGVLQYLELPTVTITPQAKSDAHTQNYKGDFNKLDLSGISRFQIDGVDAPIEDALQKGVDDTNKVKLTANYSEGSLTENDAVLSYEYSGADNFIYTHEQNSEIIPFTSTIHLSIATVMDNDSVTANDADDDPDGLGAILETDTVITLTPTGKEIRFGRAYLQNSFGPETSDLPQPFSVQYINTDGVFVVNDLDTCTNYNTDKIILTNNNVATSVISSDGQLASGETRSMVLKAVTAGNQGSVNVEYDIYDWLKYDWHWNGVTAKEFDENPTAIATFGLFRGNDRIIYQREVID